MKVQVVDTDSGLDALEGSWNALAGKRPSSFFSTFDYVRTAWRHFHGPADHLFVLTLRNGSCVEGIAPLCIRHLRKRGIPHRAIRLIPAWEGDRPGILTAGSDEAAWRDIFGFLETEFRDWEVLELIEQPVEGPDGNGWSCLDRPGWYWESAPGGIDHYISLEGSWEEYLRSLGHYTRKNWRKRSRRLSESPGGSVVEWIADPGRMREALLRFVALERLGWKAEAGIGVSKDERHRAFYEDILRLMAARGQATVCFLKSGEEDIAGAINFMQQGVIFVRHTTYSPAYEQYSPGILLKAEIVRKGFGDLYTECDLLVMKEHEAPRSKFEWANGQRRTVDQTGYRVRSRLLPLIAAKQLGRLFGKDSGQGTEGG